MEADSLLSNAMNDIINDLSIHQISVVDEDFVACPKFSVRYQYKDRSSKETTAEVESCFGPKPPDSNFLATQLLACYRSEMAASSYSEDEREYLSVNAMPDAQCRIFKKKMKKRIHEWEAAVLAETGEAEVRQSIKAPLRMLYELYRASKNRISSSDFDTTSTGIPRSSAATTARLSATSTAQSEVSVSQPQPASGTDNNVSSSWGSSTMHDDPTAGRAGNAVDPRIDNIVDRLPPIRIGTAAPASMTTSELSAEKHQIKQLLHRFENDVFYALGYRPPRSGIHRRRLTSVYHRYGELKAELQRRSQDGSSQGD